MELEIKEYLPRGWELKPQANGVLIYAPDGELAQEFHVGARKLLERSAKNLQSVIQIAWDGCDRPLKIGRAKSSASNSTPADTHNTQPQRINSYAPDRVSSTASYEEILDFIKGKKAEGLIVTVTGMGSDKCLIVNDLQSLDRGGGWTAQDWIGIDFKTLWRDSFHMGQTNYYGRLIQLVESDRFIPEYLYRIRRPSGALAEYSSTYTLVENFLGRAARIAVSKVGAWRIVEDAPDGSEVAT